jgi:hypothetical protein
MAQIKLFHQEDEEGLKPKRSRSTKNPEEDLKPNPVLIKLFHQEPRGRPKTDPAQTITRKELLSQA